jgi:hypothetical protein
MVGILIGILLLLLVVAYMRGAYIRNHEDGLNDALLGRPRRVWTAGAGYAAGYREGSRRLLKQRDVQAGL